MNYWIDQAKSGAPPRATSDYMAALANHQMSAHSFECLWSLAAARQCLCLCGCLDSGGHLPITNAMLLLFQLIDALLQLWLDCPISWRQRYCQIAIILCQHTQSHPVRHKANWHRSCNLACKVHPGKAIILLAEQFAMPIHEFKFILDVYLYIIVEWMKLCMIFVLACVGGRVHKLNSQQAICSKALQ